MCWHTGWVVLLIKLTLPRLQEVVENKGQRPRAISRRELESWTLALNQSCITHMIQSHPEQNAIQYNLAFFFLREPCGHGSMTSVWGWVQSLKKSSCVCTTIRPDMSRAVGCTAELSAQLILPFQFSHNSNVTQTRCYKGHTHIQILIFWWYILASIRFFQEPNLWIWLNVSKL